MKTKISETKFKQWLFALPSNTQFNYICGKPTDEAPCPMCRFLMDTLPHQTFAVGGTNIDIENETVKIPDWFMDLRVQDLLAPINADDLRRKWKEVHG